ncbi:high-potential iron-sulfur protein [Roseateles sp. SL47]|uniref:high-potential iron-sulfur protein n=1 Tax=Roseateles sp. SL47 TaxID=2995138 RepID=UPI00226DB7EF|nr:high-potential iron-sulfur protein [Roseateles sp. SL47]WAC73208.1 high-potential iron-sulfur protein [Roseateles sp. SL47]
MNSRRQFIRLVPLAGVGLLVGPAWSQTMVDEKDPTAASLGYHADASKVDKAKQPKYVAGAACGNCSLFQGKAGAPSGPCPIFAGKHVAAKGWCSAYVKKA